MFIFEFGNKLAAAYAKINRIKRQKSKGVSQTMKTFKKTLSVFLAALMALSCFALCAGAADEKAADALKVAVASDIHTTEAETISDINGDGMFGNKGAFASLHDESYGVVDSFMREAIENGAKYILITGDLTNKGTAEQHKKLAAYLESFQKESGVPIYVVPGNHDYYNMAKDGVEFFRQTYYNLGFAQSYAQDKNTCSYVTDLDDNYTLIAIDSNLPGKTRDGITDELYSWIYEQAAAAQKRGKKVIAMMHHPIMSHFPLHELLTAFVVENWRVVSSKFADAGIKYVFTGHKHVGDIAKRTSAKGNEVYDLSAPSLLVCPVEYRLVTFSDEKVEVRTKSVSKIHNTALLAKGHSEKALKMLSTDLPAYSNELFDETCRYAVNYFLNADTLCELIKTKDSVIHDTLDGVCKRAKKLIFAPLYGGEDSVQATAKTYGITLPKSDYKTGFDVAMVLMKAHFSGDENFAGDSTEMKLAVKCVAVLLANAFEGVPNDLKFAVFNAVFKLINVDPAKLGINLKKLIFTHNSDGEFGIAVATALFAPVLDTIMVDSEPGDKNVDLPAYGEVNGKLGVENIVGIIKKVVEFLKAFLAYVSNVLKVSLG